LEVTLTARAHDPGASITIAGKKVVSGRPSAPFLLAIGDNPIDVTVQAADPTLPPVGYHVDVRGSPSDYLKADQPKANDEFGFAVALDGDTLAVSATGAAPDGKETGAVYIFSRKNGVWSQTAFIKPPRPRDFLMFGKALALQGDTLVVGAYGETGAKGGVNP